MKLNLSNFFKLIENESYVVIKPSEILPEYKEGSDIDLFCYHPKKMTEVICSFLSSYIDSNSSICVEENECKVHVDYLVSGAINFRFDIYKSLPKYKNVMLKDAFFSSVIESSQDNVITNDDSTINIKVPSLIDDFIIRYVEYHEYYAERPDKIKHINYIHQTIPKEQHLTALDKLHFYTAFPKPAYRSKTVKERSFEKYEYYSSMIAKAKHLYKTAGFKSLFKKIANKLG